MDAAGAITVENYDELIALLRWRICEVNMTPAGVDHLAGLSDRYASMVLRRNGTKHLGPISLFPIIQALGLRLIVPDDAALAKLRRRSDWISMRRAGPRYRPRRGQCKFEARINPACGPHHRPILSHSDGI